MERAMLFGIRKAPSGELKTNLITSCIDEWEAVTDMCKRLPVEEYENFELVDSKGRSFLFKDRRVG
jgi:hypothetical protein